MSQSSKSPIRQYRRKLGLRPRDLASQLGVSEATLRSYENGNRKIPAEFAVQFEKKTGVHRSKLLPALFGKAA